MTDDSEIHVILSDELHRRLYASAAGSDIPLDWFVAGLVCDTIETFGHGRLADLSSPFTLRLLSPGGANASSTNEPSAPRDYPRRLVHHASEEA